MRKIKNVDDAIEKFKMAANDNYECSYNGNYRKSNRAYDDLIQIEKYLFENNALDLLKQLYDDSNLWVRLAAAIAMAPFDDENAFNIVKKMTDGEDLYSFSAKRTLLNWDKLNK